MTEERLTHDFDPLEPETFTSAHERYKDMRRKCPVAHSNEFNGFWALFKYRDIERVLKDYRNFVTSVQNVVPKVAFTGRRPPLRLDPPEHTPYRRAINPFFSNQRMDMLKNDVRRMVAELLEPLLQREEGDISDEFAQKLPGYVFAKLFNLTQELAMDIKRCTAVYNRAVQRADDRMVKETSLKLYDIARRMIAMRKAEPMDPAEDIVSALLSATHNGEPLPEDMVLGAVRQLMVVGMIAPSVFVGNMAVHLSEHRDLQERLRSEPRLIPAAVEEYFRLFSPYRGFARTSKTDVVIGGRADRAGVHLRQPGRRRLSRAGPIHPASPEHSSAHRVWIGSASMSRSAACPHDDDRHAGGTFNEDEIVRSGGGDPDDPVARMGDAVGAAQIRQSLNALSEVKPKDTHKEGAACRRPSASM